MASIFDTDDSPCGVFAPRAGMDAYQLVSFVRVAHLVSGRSITQAADGGLLPSYVGISTFVLDLQPKSPSFPRYIGGNAVTVDFQAFIVGFADLRVGDRCYVSTAGQGGASLQLEIIGSLHFGTNHTELEMRIIGR